MTSTPQRSQLNTSVYSPVRFLDTSPKSLRNNDPLGIRHQVRIILKTIIDNHKKWELAQKRGVTLCCAIENIKKEAFDRKVSEPSETLYPDDLRIPSEKLKIITTIFKDVLHSGRESLRHLSALKNSQQNSNEKLLKSWTMEKVVRSVENIVQAYCDEYDVKVKVMENVCHSSCKEEIVFHVCFWEFETFINDDVRFAVSSIKVECDFEDKIK